MFDIINITVKLLHSSLILIISVSVEKALDGSRRYSMTTQLISFFQHFLNIILSIIDIYFNMLVDLRFLYLHISAGVWPGFSSSEVAPPLSTASEDLENK